MAPSKTYNIAGLCCAFSIISDPKLRLAFEQAARGLIGKINPLGYVGLSAAYQHGEPWRKELIIYLRNNRDFLYRFIQTRIPELKLMPMEATYLAWIGAGTLKVENPTEFFENAGVGLSPGDIFGEDGKGFVRLNFGCSRATLEKALLRMEIAVRKLARQK